MSKQQAVAFFEEISRNKQLAKEVEKVVGGNNSDEAKAKELLSLAKKGGFIFTKEEAMSVQGTQYTELSINDLVEVSGGKGGFKSSFMALALFAGLGVGGAAMSSMEASAHVTDSVQTSPGASSAQKKSDLPIGDIESKLPSSSPARSSSPDTTSSSDSIVSAGTTEDNIIDMLHSGDMDSVSEVQTRLDEIDDDDYEKLDSIAQQLFNNKNITLPRNPKLAKSWIKNWSKVVSVFPELRGEIQLVAESTYSPGGGTSSEAMLDTITHYGCLIEQDITPKTKYKQVNGYDRTFTIVHEIGHVLVQLLQGSQCEEILNEAYANIPKSNREGSLDAEIAKMSPYAANSGGAKYDEAFAETLTDVVINGEEASNLSKETMRLLVNRIPNRDNLELARMMRG